MRISDLWNFYDNALGYLTYFYNASREQPNNKVYESVWKNHIKVVDGLWAMLDEKVDEIDGNDRDVVQDWSDERRLALEYCKDEDGYYSKNVHLVGGSY